MNDGETVNAQQPNISIVTHSNTEHEAVNITHTHTHPEK